METTTLIDTILDEKDKKKESEPEPEPSGQQ